MTLRAKTRSRKGRDLKRLDGVNRRLTRRRRIQRGGAVPVATYEDWRKAVNEQNTVYKTRTEPSSEDYSISRVKEYSDSHQLPVFNGESLDKFAMSNGVDVRSAAANVAAMLKLVMDANPTIGQFQNEMRVQLQPGADAVASTDVQAQLQVLAEIEHAIRTDFGKGESSPSTKEISVPTDILTDVSAYPLYIWALYYSAPSGAESIPILTPPEKVASEIGSSEPTQTR